MKPRFEISDAGEERTIRVRMIGQFDLTTMNDFAREYRRVSRVYTGTPHMVLADMRGSQPAQDWRLRALRTRLGAGVSGGRPYLTLGYFRLRYPRRSNH